jgi:gamma-glutamyltranspeptidase
LWSVFGTPGADNQIQVNLEVLTAMIDFGLDPQQAAELPRWTSNVPGQYANWPHHGEDPLTIERRFPEAVRRELGRRGHLVKIVGDLEGPCSVEIIRRDAATGMLLAGSDPRRDGWALAWRSPWSRRRQIYFFEAGVIVPKSPSCSSFGPAVK